MRVFNIELLFVFDGPIDINVDKLFRFVLRFTFCGFVIVSFSQLTIKQPKLFLLANVFPLLCDYETHTLHYYTFENVWKPKSNECKNDIN